MPKEARVVRRPLRTILSLFFPPTLASMPTHHTSFAVLIPKVPVFHIGTDTGTLILITEEEKQNLLRQTR